MAEIKSTLDLVMERTKDLTLSAEEKRQLAAKESRQRAQALAQRLRRGLLDPRQLERELENLPAESRQATKGEIVRHLVRGLSCAESTGVEIDALRFLVDSSQQPLVAEIAALLNHYQKLESEELARTRERLLAALEARGIRGSAVRPNPEADPEWRRRQQQLRHECGAALERLRSQLA